ncbi:SPRY domain protein [Spraguea lophii 42_110]|uniref:SPRY domain protein n=1 Tax=Spraguea lophii (strain 42_110) TaxID=1358809 RepID=S7XJT5_SPRLO|nr:SPRY domain protein [Spraguea lophii 42_110]
MSYNTNTMVRLLGKVSLYSISEEIVFTADNCTVGFLYPSKAGVFKSCISTYSSLNGYLYFEVEIINVTNCRIGIVNNFYNKYAPVGYDNNGYSFGNDGYIFNNGKRYNYRNFYKAKDIIGVFVRINGGKIDIKENIVCETKVKSLRKGSFVKFFKNNEDLGIAFNNLEGEFFTPIISMTLGTEVRFNFGPFFAYPENIEENL